MHAHVRPRGAHGAREPVERGPGRTGRPELSRGHGRERDEHRRMAARPRRRRGGADRAGACRPDRPRTAAGSQEHLLQALPGEPGEGGRAETPDGGPAPARDRERRRRGDRCPDRAELRDAAEGIVDDGAAVAVGDGEGSVVQLTPRPLEVQMPTPTAAPTSAADRTRPRALTGRTLCDDASARPDTGRAEDGPRPVKDGRRSMRREDEFDPGSGDHEGRASGQLPRSGMSPKWIGAGIGAILLLIFAVQNGERVDVDFLFFDSQVRVVVVIAISAALGFVIGWFIGRPARAERRAMRRGMND